MLYRANGTQVNSLYAEAIIEVNHFKRMNGLILYTVFGGDKKRPYS